MNEKSLLSLGFKKIFVPKEESGCEFGYTYFHYETENGRTVLITNEKDENSTGDFEYSVQLFDYPEFGSTKEFERVFRLIDTLNKFEDKN